MLLFQCDPATLLWQKFNFYDRFNFNTEVATSFFVQPIQIRDVSFSVKR